MHASNWLRSLPGWVRRVFSSGGVVLGLLLIAVRPALAAGQSLAGFGQGVVLMGILGGLGDIIVGAIKTVLKVLFSPIRAVIENHGDALLRVVLETPHPDATFGAPSNDPWPAIYEYYWEMLIPLTLTLYGLAIGIVILLESTSHLFSNYHTTKLKKRAFSGLLGILSWWWIAALSLQFMDALAAALVPSLSDISLFQTLSFSGIGVLGLVITMMVDLALFILIGLIYLMRRLVLFLFVLMMPILIVLWIPGVGPFALASKFMRRLAGFYVPFLFMTIPVAVLLRLGELLGQSADLSASGIGSWLTALVTPFVAVILPFVLFWQAGALLFLGERASRHMSAQRARTRASRGGDRLRKVRHGGRNFVRGVRDELPVRSGGQTMLDSGSSRAHAVGQRASYTGTRLREVFRSEEANTERTRRVYDSRTRETDENRVQLGDALFGSDSTDSEEDGADTRYDETEVNEEDSRNRLDRPERSGDTDWFASEDSQETEDESGNDE